MDGFDPNYQHPGDPLDEEIKIEAKESIKIIKNSKGWNFEVKIVDKENIEPQMDRLDRIMKRLQEKYPNDK
jgi:hypothetical protein